MKFCISYGSYIKADSKMFAPNRHDNLIERPKTRYPKIPFQECEINQIHRTFLYLKDIYWNLPLLKLLTHVYALVHD